MSSNNLETNKIFAAVLVAGIVAMLAGFVAEQFTHHEMPEKDAVAIEGMAEGAGGGAAAASGPEPILALIATADVAQGEKLSKACAACHSFDNGGANKVGPGLYGVVGAKKAAHAGFAYSDALAGMGGSWDYDALNHFLWSPKKYAPGTKMSYAGLKKPEDRAALIVWLRTLGGSLGAPSAADIAAEAAKLAPPAEAAPATEAAPVEAPAAH